jgi:hypothetical protein
MKIPVVALDLALFATAPASGAEHPRDPQNPAKVASRLSVMANTCSKYFTANVEIGREFQQRAIDEGRSLWPPCRLDTAADWRAVFLLAARPLLA